MGLCLHPVPALLLLNAGVFFNAGVAAVSEQSAGVCVCVCVSEQRV
jgi:hypothetical protein